MTEVESKVIKVSEATTLPETRNIRPHLNAMEGVAKVVANEAVLANKGGVVTVKATIHRSVPRQWLGVWRGAVERMRGSSLTRQHRLLSLGGHIQERLEAITNRLVR